MTVDELHHLYNRHRTELGMPAATFAPGMARACDEHNNYMEVNGTYDHGEDPTKPGYSELYDGAEGDGGAWLMSEVLSMDSWSETQTPWDDAPLHILGLFDPEYDVAGGAVSHGFACHRTGQTRGYAPPAAFYAFPSTSRRIPVSVTVAERPFAPQEKVGIPQGKRTGWQVIAWASGMGRVSVDSAQVLGPSGPVESRFWFDSDHGVVVIPVEPLEGNRDYTYRVNWVTPQGPQQQNAVYRTEQLSNAVSVDVVSDGAGAVAVVRSSAPDAVVEVTTADGRTHRPRVLAKLPATATDDAAEDLGLDWAPEDIRGFVRFSGPPGRSRICASSGSPDGNFAEARRCRNVRLRASWTVRLTVRKRRLTLTPMDYTDGRTATVVVHQTKWGCRPLGPIKECGAIFQNPPLTRTLQLRGSRSMALPKRWQVGRRRGLWIRVRVPRGRTGSTVVPALEIVRQL